MKVCVLASGSSGNSIYVEQNGTALLIDAGMSGKRIEERLRAVGAEADRLRAIVVTHEHADHIQGVGVLARRYRIPVWLTEGTLKASRGIFKGREPIRLFQNDEAFAVGDLHFQPFSLSHDAADPVNFSVSAGDSRLAVATDTGTVTHLVRERLRGSDLVVIESNHDPDMLMNGPYPWHLKQRINGNQGHLANGRAAETLKGLAEEGLKQAVLAHLSEQNNRPELALEACRSELGGRGLADFRLSVAFQERPSDVFVI